MNDDGVATAPVRSERSHRRRRFVIGVLVVVLVASAFVITRLWSERGGKEASVDTAVKNFRRSTTGAGDSTALRPAAGVYSYDATGNERLSVLATDQGWGPTLPATVTHDDDPNCWTLRLDYSTNHWQTFDFCVGGGGLQDIGGSSFQRFDFVAFSIDDLNEFSTDPPYDLVRTAAKPGDSWPTESHGGSAERGTSVTSRGVQTYVGPETVTVGGHPVRTFHYRSERTLSGDQSGTEHLDAWYAEDDAMLLEFARDARVESPSPIGTVTYTETGNATLSSRTPKR